MPLRLSAAVLLLSLAQARGAEWTVSGISGELTIAAALGKAAPGDTIRVHPGIYTGNLVLDRPVTLIGEGRPVLRGSGHGSVVTVNASGCVLRGFRIEHSGASLIEEDSGILLRSGYSQVIGNELHDVLFGIYFYRAHDNLVRENVVHGRTEIRVGERGAGLHLWDSHRNTIEGNTVSGTRDGMYIQNANRSTIRHNRVSNVRYGLHYMNSDDNVFEDNAFDNNVAGAAIMYSNRIQLRRNRFVHNRGFSSFGILFQDSVSLIAEHNIVSDNAVGLFLEAVRNSVFQANLIANNDTAIEIFANSDRNEFTRNNFAANLTPIRVIGRSTTTRWSSRGQGNYWSDYDGYDLDGNGVGDVPFHIRNLYERMENDLPRLRLYFDSPAARALVAAERAFPVMRTSAERDEHPLMKPVALPVSLTDNGPGVNPLAASVPLKPAPSRIAWQAAAFASAALAACARMVVVRKGNPQ
jgi:nitrous oxidase accessory protein